MSWVEGRPHRGGRQCQTGEMRRVVLLACVLGGAVLAGCTSQPPLAPEVPGLEWKTLPAAPSERTEVTATVAAGKIYVIGGYRADGGTVDTVEVFDLASQRWSSGPPLPLAVNHAMSATVSDTVYVVGGYVSNGEPAAALHRLGASGWEALAPLPQPRAAATAVALDGKIYVAAGVAKGGLARDMYVYDTATDGWTIAPGPPTPREHLGGAGFGGLVYTVGGRTGGLDTNLTAFEAYDPATGQWRTLPELPTRRGGLAATAICTGHIIAMGGEAKATFAEAEAFDVRAGTWRSLPGLPTARHGLGATASGTTLFAVAGGRQPGLHVSNVLESLDLTSLAPCP